MTKQSAGILAYRFRAEIEFFLVHPGGPIWANKDIGAWSIPKGEFENDEAPLYAACRELFEETGHRVEGDFAELTPIVQKAGKRVFAWSIEANIDADSIVSNTFEMEWPPRSGRRQSFPEVDRAGWFGLEQASQKINPAQQPLLLEVLRLVKYRES